MKGETVKLETELAEIGQKNLWKLYIEAISKERDVAVDHCIKDKLREDIRFFQGKVQVIDYILSLPERIIKREKEKRHIEEIPR